MLDIITPDGTPEPWGAQKYRILLIDPAWPYNARRNPKTKFGLGANRYSLMTVPQIAALPIQEIAADDCALFLWTTGPHTKYMPMVMEHYGFRFITKAFTWVKMSKAGTPRKLTGHYTMSNTEDCWLGIRGRMRVATRGVGQVVTSELGTHSTKPNEVRERIVRLFGDLPRIELFARQIAPGWAGWGLEAKHGEAANVHALAQSGNREPVITSTPHTTGYTD